MMSFVIIRLPSKRDMDTQWTHKKLSKERMTSYLQFQHHRLNPWLTISRNLDWGGGRGVQATTTTAHNSPSGGLVLKGSNKIKGMEISIHRLFTY